MRKKKRKGCVDKRRGGDLIYDCDFIDVRCLSVCYSGLEGVTNTSLRGDDVPYTLRRHPTGRCRSLIFILY